MDSIDVHDLPEPVARALAEQAEFLRKQFVEKRNGGVAKRVKFAERLGTVYGQLTREEIYADDFRDETSQHRKLRDEQL